MCDRLPAHRGTLAEMRPQEGDLVMCEAGAKQVCDQHTTAITDLIDQVVIAAALGVGDEAVLRAELGQYDAGRVAIVRRGLTRKSA